MKNKLDQMARKILSDASRETLYLRTFGMLKIPLIFFCSPSVLELSEERCVVKIPLNRRTQNHLKCMYFGALSVGADVAGGIIAMRMIEAEKAKVSLIFKDFKAEFLKRAEGDVHFTCEEGAKIRKQVRRAIESGERENEAFEILATVPSKLGTEPVAKFTLTLSLKKKS